MKPRSLNTRLIVVVVSTIVLSWIAVVGVVFMQFSLNQTSTSDKELATIATQLLLTIPADSSFAERAGPGLQLRDPPDVDLELLVFQIWIDRHRLFVATPGAPTSPFKPDFTDGLTSTVIEGKKWRVYSVSDKTGRVTVQAGNPQDVVDADMRDVAGHVLIVATVLLLIVGVIMGFVTKRTFKPVRAMSASMRHRHSFDFTPLPLHDLPTELHPFVASFNDLLLQLDKAVEGERRFIGEAAHELRTPLSAVHAQAEIALNSTELKGKDAALKKLLVVAERSTRLSEQLLDLARINAGTKAPKRAHADLRKLVEHVAQEVEVYASQNRRSLYLDVRSCIIECDIDEIGILLRNLLHNAMRYTSDEGVVLVCCGYVADAKPGMTPDVYLEVSDDGPGVAAAEREAIFERFYRAAGTKVRGSGIGLSLVASIAKSHNASIKVDTGLDGRGLTVRVVFPGFFQTAI
ncbi:sensor histidine kinase [Bordetella tumulicola]|uniref:sensor histidine kinase n=1 Tax=Bordetella tumulicola TaxID=1649133 RepID=UPI0039EE0798